MIERTNVCITILYDPHEAQEAVLKTKYYQSLGFTITPDNDTPKKGAKGYYILRLGCEKFEHPVFSLEDKGDYKDFYKILNKKKKYEK